MYVQQKKGKKKWVISTKVSKVQYAHSVDSQTVAGCPDCREASLS